MRWTWWWRRWRVLFGEIQAVRGRLEFVDERCERIERRQVKTLEALQRIERALSNPGQAVTLEMKPLPPTEQEV